MMLDLLYGKGLEAYKKAAVDAGIPERMVQGIYDYIEHHSFPGGFLQALFCDSLMWALRRADDENINLLKEYMTFLIWCLPGEAWGSKKKFDAWVAKTKEGG